MATLFGYSHYLHPYYQISIVALYQTLSEFGEDTHS